MIYICAGHSAAHGPDYDPGAIANGYKEADLAVELRDLTCGYLRAEKALFKTDEDNWNLSKTMANAKTSDSDIVFDIHFNAASVAASGCEIFVANKAEVTDNEKSFAKAIVDDLSKILGLPNRGVKTEDQCRHKRLGMMRPKGMNFLIEICFITNKNDMKTYQIVKPQIAQMIAKKLIEADNKIK